MRQSKGLVRAVALAATLFLSAAGLSVLGASDSAQALSGSLFQAGNIISDQNMFNANAMSQAQIQAFLQSQIGGCTNGSCLNVLQMPTTSRAASSTPSGTAVCSAYAGAVSESAAAVIFKVQQACGVSAKAILVILQKEEGLVTSRAPSAGKLQRAMGYGCPDSAGGACSSLYDGFYNQIYWAAWQLKRYGANPAVGSYHPGVNAILFSPNTACGSTSVNILNRATAALYNYTPYQPNAAALANLSGTGDGCSSYGNRNFWVYYSNWFGSPDVPPGTPEGALVSVSPTGGKIGLSGWSVDPDALTATVAVSIQVDSNWYALNANAPGDDLGAEYPGAGANHYFSGAIPAAPGVHTMCIYLVNAGGAGGTGTFGCQQVTVPPGPPPVGGITNISAANGIISFSGWAVQPDQLSAVVPVAIEYNNGWSAFPTGDANTVAPAQVSGAGPNQGFHGTLSAATGLQTICAWAAPSAGPAIEIGCRSISVAAESPAVTSLGGVTASASSVSVSGWAVWPGSVSTSVPIAVNIGSNWYGFTANQASAAAASAVSGAGPNHGYTGSIPLSPGSYSVCVWVAQQSGPATNLGCQTVTVTSAAAAIAQVVSVTASASSVSVSGWAVWPGSVSTSVPIAVNIGSNWYAFTANQASAAAASAVSGAGPNHGYVGSIPLSPGSYSVCVWVAQQSGPATNLGCQTVTVTSAAASAAVAQVVSVAASASSVSVSGWAVWPGSVSASVPIAVNIGSNWYAFTANQASAAAASAVSGAGPNHGYVGSIPLSAGRYSVCVWVAQQSGPATNLGCQTAIVAQGPPVLGAMQSVVSGVGGLHYSGWAVDPSSPASPVILAANIGSSWIPLTTGDSSNVAQGQVGGAGPNQGFSGLFPVAPGTYPICVWATSAAGTVNLGCKTGTVDPPPAVAGAITTATTAAGTITVSGWAVAPSALSTSVLVAVNVGTNWSAVPSNLTNTIAAKYVVGVGANQGYGGTVAAPSGSQQVCVWAAPPVGPAIELGCQTVTVP